MLHTLSSLTGKLSHRERALLWGLIATLLLALGYLVYATGGTHQAFLHLLYLPVILAGVVFHMKGGLVTGLAAGLLVGPWMPLVVETGELQSTVGWLSRSAFFMLIGSFTGVLSRALGERVQALDEAVEALSSTCASTLRSFTALMEVYDEPTGAHCERVAHNACVLGRALKLSEDSLEALYWAGILHDVGKVSVPSSVLLKPGKLTLEEYKVVKAHTTFGAELLTSISPAFERIALGVRSHHERWDGEGYPDGLVGKEIPLFGRILAVVDVFEALTSDRPYRDPLPAEEALAYLEAHVGAHFDTQLVILYRMLYRQGDIFVAGGRCFPARHEESYSFKQLIVPTLQKLGPESPPLSRVGQGLRI